MEILFIPAAILIALGSLLAGLVHRHEKTKWVFISIALVGFAMAYFPLGKETSRLHNACEETRGYYSCQNDLRPWGPLFAGTAVMGVEASFFGLLGFTIERWRRPVVGRRRSRLSY